MTKNTETRQPVELNDDEMNAVQGGGFVPGSLSKTGKQVPGQAGIIVVDEDGLSAPSDQFPG